MQIALTYRSAAEDGHQSSPRRKDEDPMPQDGSRLPLTEWRHTQKGKQTTKEGVTKELIRFRKELVDKPVVAVTSRDTGDVEGLAWPSPAAPTPSPTGEATHGDKPPFCSVIKDEAAPEEQPPCLAHRWSTKDPDEPIAIGKPKLHLYLKPKLAYTSGGQFLTPLLLRCQKGRRRRRGRGGTDPRNDAATLSPLSPVVI